MTAEEILIQIRQRRQQQFDAADVFEKIRIIEQDRINDQNRSGSDPKALVNFLHRIKKEQK